LAPLKEWIFTMAFTGKSDRNFVILTVPVTPEKPINRCKAGSVTVICLGNLGLFFEAMENSACRD
jgi:hypothetical protein